MSGDILYGDGRSQYTDVNVFPGDSGGVGGGVVNWPSQPWSQGLLKNCMGLLSQRRTVQQAKMSRTLNANGKLRRLRLNANV